MLLSYKTLSTHLVGMIIWIIENGGKRSLENMVWEDVWLGGKYKRKWWDLGVFL